MEDLPADLSDSFDILIDAMFGFSFHGILLFSTYELVSHKTYYSPEHFVMHIPLTHISSVIVSDQNLTSLDKIS